MKQDWELDMFSTFLSRKHSYHKVIGPVRYVRMCKVTKQQPVKNEIERQPAELMIKGMFVVGFVAALFSFPF